MKVTIIERRVVPSLDPTRLGKNDAFVIFSVEGGHVSSVVLPEEQASEVAVQAEIKKQLQTRTALLGKTFDVTL